MFNKYPYVKQCDNNECGPACLATVMKYYGKHMPLSRVRKLVRTDVNGTNILAIVEAAKILGFSVKAVEAKQKDSICGVYPKPAIAHVIYEDAIRHYVVIYKVTEKEVIVADTGRGIVRYSLEEFKAIWTGKLIILSPTEAFTKEKKRKSERIKELILAQKRKFIKIFVCSLCCGGLGIVGALYYTILIDYIIVESLETLLLNISVTMICVGLMKCVIEFLRKILLCSMAKEIDKRLLLEFYHHILRLPMEFFDSRECGSIVSKFDDGVKIREAISSAAVTVMMDIFIAIAGGIILYKQNVSMFIMSCIPILLYFVLAVVYKKHISTRSTQVMENNSKVTTFLVETINGIEVVKACTAEKNISGKFTKKFNEFVKAIYNYNVLIGIQDTVKGMVKAIFSVAILWLGTYFVLHEKMTVGEMISFNALLVYFIEPIERVINLQPQIQNAVIAADRLEQIFGLETEKYEKEHVNAEISIKGDINIEQVIFRYSYRKKILENFSLKIKSGERIALVGQSGSGKSTIAKLLLNLYPLESGKITINNHDISEIPIDLLRRKVAYISQETYFFAGTIRENLIIGNENISAKVMVEMCKRVCMHDYIMSLPKGYDNILAEGGANLSSGQRQRLAVARALLKQPEILIMDEATSNLDAITESIIEEVIEKCTEGLTTIIVAHHLRTAKKCDIIYAIDSGKIKEFGNHSELLNKRGYYYELWKKQNQ